MMDLNLLLSAFALIALTELGDKSSLTIMTLASRYDRRSVFIGSFVALLLMTILGIALGSIVAEFIPQDIMVLIGAIIFLAFGSYSLLAKDDEDDSADLKEGGVMLGTFLLLVMMELGDKTQISVFTLAATGDWLPVLIGAAAAFLLLVGLSTFVGDAIGRRVDEALMKRVSSLVFILFGIVYLLMFLMGL